MRCLVTGVAGFIGSFLAERPITEGNEVIGIDLFTDYYARSLKAANLRRLISADRFRLIEADLNYLPLQNILKDIDWIFHLAAQAGVRASWGKDFDTYLASNVLTTQRLLEAAYLSPKIKRFIYASSSSVYGDSASNSLREGDQKKPLSPYGITKLAVENLCNAYWEQFGIPIIVLRYFTVYGPRQRPDMSFYRFGLALLKNEEISFYGDGTQARDFTYVGDIVDATLLAAQVPGIEGLTFNVGSGRRVSLNEAIQILESICGRKALIHIFDPAPGDVQNTHANISLARRYLKYAPKVSLLEGLSAELQFLSEHIYPKAMSNH